MRILHTADWHLGKKLSGIDRLDEQKEVLDQIHEIAADKKVELILIAGDVFDTATPGADAEQLFFYSLARLSRLCPVIVIAGNHDDPIRLGASESLALLCNVAIIKDIAVLPTSEQEAPVIVSLLSNNYPQAPTSSGAVITEIGNGFVKVNTPTQTAIINTMPYPSESRLKLKQGEYSTFSAAVAERLNVGASAFRQDTININVSHLFCIGSVSSGDERDIELGSARLIPIDLLPEAHYTALGHIHRCQRLSTTRNIHYSGSIMQYSFDDTIHSKCVLIADISTDGTQSVDKISITAGRRLKELTVQSYEDALAAAEKYPDYWLSLILQLSRPLTDTETRRLRFAHKNIASLKLEVADADIDHSKTVSVRRSEREYFHDYYTHKKSKPPSDELLNLYLEIMEGLE